MFLEILKLIAGLLLALPAILGLLITIEVIRTCLDDRRSGPADQYRAQFRFRVLVTLVVTLLVSLLSGAGAACLIWGFIAGMRK